MWVVADNRQSVAVDTYLYGGSMSTSMARRNQYHDRVELLQGTLDVRSAGTS